MARPARIFGISPWILLGGGIPLLAAVGLAVGFTLGWLPGIRMFWAIDRAPTVRGVVESSGVRYSRQTGGGGQYIPTATFSYTVDGRPYTSYRLRAFTQRLSNEQDAIAIVEPFPAGAEVTVHHHPSDPSIAIIDPTPQWGTFTTFVALLLLLWFIPIAIPGTVAYIFIHDHIAARRRAAGKSRPDTGRPERRRPPRRPPGR